MLSGFSLPSSLPRKPRKIAVFISGGGSTLQALLEMHHQLDVAIVVTSKRSATGIFKAKRFGKKIVFLDKMMGLDSLNEILKEHRIELLILAGFMKLLPSKFVEIWKDRILNIHPSLLPKYPGLSAAENSYRDNADMGVTIHKVITEMDAGPVLRQQIALTEPKNLTFNEASLFLRRTEQSLLRELALRYCA